MDSERVGRQCFETSTKTATATDTATRAANICHQLSGLRDCRQPNEQLWPTSKLASKL